MPDPKDPIRLGIENLLLIQRLGNGLSEDVRIRLALLRESLVEILTRIDPASPGREVYRLGRVMKILERARPATREAMDELLKDLRGELAAIGAQQAEVGRGFLGALVGDSAVTVSLEGLGVNFFKQVLDSRPFQGELLKDWVRGLEEDTLRRLRREIKLGVIRQETTDDLVRRVRGRSTGRYAVRYTKAGERRHLYRFSGGVMGTTTRRATTLVRTAVNEIANTAHLETFKQNRDITKRYEYVATLDSRVTPLCASLDGQTFDYEQPGAPRPPMHPNCRSTITAVVDWEGLGIEPPPESTRASAGGQVSSSTTAQEWLRDNPAAAREVLGASRAERFLSGDASLRDLVRSDGGLVRVADITEGAAP